MGYYIETSERTGKATELIEKYEAEIISQPSVFSPPEGKALICVVSNYTFEAAAFCYNLREFTDFTEPSDYRVKTWLLMDRALAERLSGWQS